jgi:hypothetical protein
MTFEVPQDELRALQLDYLNSTRDTVQLMKQHGKSLSSRKQFKTAFPVLLYLSHQLKGSGGSLGFPEITDLAAKMSSELNLFLDDTTPRPAPGDLSRAVTALSEQLEEVLDAAVEKIS